jgi:hypothetical protein
MDLPVHAVLLIIGYIDHTDEPLPLLDVGALLNTGGPAFMPNPHESSISIDVMHIVKNTASVISKDTNVFYDTEVLAIIHRSKSKSSGLVSTKVWGWRGKRCQYGDKEDRKLQELAKRYGTTLVSFLQIKGQCSSHDGIIYRKQCTSTKSLQNWFSF